MASNTQQQRTHGADDRVLVIEVDESVRRYWEERAEHNGRSVVVEVQRHLTEQARFPRTGPGLASDIATIFRDSSVEPGDFREISLNDWRVADVDHELSSSTPMSCRRP